MFLVHELKDPLLGLPKEYMQKFKNIIIVKIENHHFNGRNKMHLGTKFKKILSYIIFTGVWMRCSPMKHRFQGQIFKS